MAVTNFIWDELSDNVLYETDENNAVTASYLHRPERFGELISQKSGSSVSYYHYDGQHSTRKLTGDTQNITDTYIFDGFGNEVFQSGSTTNPFKYKGAVGYYTNSATNDIYVRARTYQPATGRWLSMDPMGFVDGPNLYRAFFVPNGIDYSGQKCADSCDDMLSKVENPRNVIPSFPDRGGKPGVPGTHDDICSVRVVCSDKCPLDTPGKPGLPEAPGHTGPPNQARQILICISRKITSQSDFDTVLAHELQHARDFCNRWRRKFDSKCDECQRIEERAHKVSCKFKFPDENGKLNPGFVDCVNCGKWRSCKSICKDNTPANCKGWKDVGLDDPGIPWE